MTDTTPPIEVLRAARQWAAEHRHPYPDDRMLAIVYAAGEERGWHRGFDTARRYPAPTAAASSVPTGTRDPIAVHKHAISAPIATGVCFNCGDPVVYNLAIGYCAHQDADGVTCREPWPGNPSNGDDTDAQ